MTPSDWGWLGLFAYVGVWDFTCRRGQTLSEGVARHHAARPWLTRFVVLYTVAHLLQRLPQRVDLFKAVISLRPT